MEITAHADLMIENITLIDAEHPVRSNQTVLIENGKIESIIDSNQLTTDQKKLCLADDANISREVWITHGRLVTVDALRRKHSQQNS